MSSYIALKPCRFGGTDYHKGELIPQSKVLAAKANALQNMGIIALAIESAPVKAPAAPAPKLTKK